MNYVFSLLASSDDLPKGIVGLVIFAIWVISAIVSGIKKNSQSRPTAQQYGLPQPSALEAFQRQIAERLQDAQRQMQTPLPPPFEVAGQSNRQRVEAQQQRAAIARNAKKIKQAQQQQQRKRKVAPPPIPQTRQRDALVATEVIPPIDAVPAPSARPQAPSVNAAVIAKWMTPATLRHQFVITEIFQPPLSMRE